MLCDLGAVDEPGVSAAVGHVVTNALASPRALPAAIDVHARRGRHGGPAFRRVLDEWLVDDQLVDSVLEAAMNRLVKTFQLPAMQFHAKVCGFEVDFLVVGAPVIVECDGLAVHGRDCCRVRTRP